MRPSVEWMTGSDDRILEFLEQLDGAFPNRDVAVPAGVLIHAIENMSEATVHRRLNKLENAGLIERLDDPDGYIKIDDLGKDYLEGTVGADELGLENSDG